MGDLLVKLYDLPEADPLPAGYLIKRPLAPERRTVVSWVDDHFGERWASEVEMAFSGHPITCFVAMNENSDMIGFACYNTSFKGFFGPTGIGEAYRSRGIGTALLIRSLNALRESGYAYGIIGYSGADDYYRKAVGAIPIEDSEPGPYRNWIRRS